MSDELEQGQATVKEAITSGNKDFITITTENNQTYYLIIDYDSYNKNVYFLKAVEESDLVDFLVGNNKIIAPTETKEDTSVEENYNTTQELKSNLEEKNEPNFISNLALVVLILLIGYGIYSKFVKKKKPVNLSYEDNEDDEDEHIILDGFKNKKDREVEEKELEEDDSIF